jgi:hypothetical protein
MKTKIFTKKEKKIKSISLAKLINDNEITTLTYEELNQLKGGEGEQKSNVGFG